MKLRNLKVVTARMRPGAGPHGGSPRAKNRRDRKAAKREARDA